MFNQIDESQSEKFYESRFYVRNERVELKKKKTKIKNYNSDGNSLKSFASIKYSSYSEFWFWYSNRIPGQTKKLTQKKKNRKEKLYIQVYSTDYEIFIHRMYSVIVCVAISVAFEMEFSIHCVYIAYTGQIY